MFDGTAFALNQTAVYALRAMIALAQIEPGARLRADEIAAKTQIPRHYVNKVMRRLVVAKLVDGLRGHGGGFGLRRPPSAVRFADILRAIEPGPGVQPCAFGLKRCDALAPCPLHGAWTVINEAITRWAESTTLQSCLAPPPR